MSPFSILHHSYDEIHEINTVTTPTTISNKFHHHENEESHKESEMNKRTISYHLYASHMILLSTMYAICSAFVAILPESQTHFNQCIPSRSHFHADSWAALKMQKWMCLNMCEMEMKAIGVFFLVVCVVHIFPRWESNNCTRKSKIVFIAVLSAMALSYPLTNGEKKPLVNS